MAGKKSFKFPLGAAVKVRGTERAGPIVGRANYLRRDPGYLVEYVDHHGNLETNWFEEATLDLASGEQPEEADAE